jgi:DNA (cytosine-5)-methyltransferase 1
MRHLDLCSGTGIVSAACELLDIETVAFCEIDKFCQSILQMRFPGIPVINDVKQITKEYLCETGVINYESGRTIELVTAGFP